MHFLIILIVIIIIVKLVASKKTKTTPSSTANDQLDSSNIKTRLAEADLYFQHGFKENAEEIYREILANLPPNHSLRYGIEQKLLKLQPSSTAEEGPKATSKPNDFGSAETPKSKDVSTDPNSNGTGANEKPQNGGYNFATNKGANPAGLGSGLIECNFCKGKIKPEVTFCKLCGIKVRG